MRVRTIVLFIFAILVMPLSALAQDLHAPHVGTTSECPAVWHFVHNQVPGAEQGALTAKFQNAGTVTVSANKVLKSTQHYDIKLDSPDVLLGASDNVEGGKLVLSHVECVETQTTTTTTTTATTATTTTTTTPPDTTSTTTTSITTPPESTTTTAPPETTTTSTIPETSTTTIPGTTSTTLTVATLPETGAGSTGMLAGLGIAALLSGTGLLFLARYAKES